MWSHIDKANGLFEQNSKLILTVKIGVWLNTNYTPTTGGGYSYYQKIIHEIDQYTFNENLEVVFIQRQGAVIAQTRKELIVIPFFRSRNNIALNLLRGFFIRTRLYRIAEFIRKKRLQKLNRLEISFLKENEIDIIYYASQIQQEIDNYPSVLTNWDIGHRSSHAFPEFSMNGRFEIRDNWYQNVLPKALLVVVESETGKKELMKYTNILENRVLVLPMFPSGVTELDISAQKQTEVLTRIGLERDNFIFYPAQFWPHKNHFNLVLAMKSLQQNLPNLKLVLTGSDKGNWPYIKQVIEEYQLSKQVLNLGFVSEEVLYSLYSNALALVMPTFLGPTNMPLLEARALSCPVICSDLEGHREMMGDGALYFNPCQPVDIADCVTRISNQKTKDELLMNARAQHQNKKFDVGVSIQKLEDGLMALVAIRKCWGSFDRIS